MKIFAREFDINTAKLAALLSSKMQAESATTEDMVIVLDSSDYIINCIMTNSIAFRDISVHTLRSIASIFEISTVSLLKKIAFFSDEDFRVVNVDSESVFADDIDWKLAELQRNHERKQKILNAA